MSKFFAVWGILFIVAGAIGIGGYFLSVANNLSHLSIFSLMLLVFLSSVYGFCGFKMIVWLVDNILKD